jgi:putative transposase
VSQTVSPATGKPYGVKRACGVLSFARSSFYACQAAPSPKAGDKTGPKSKWSDEQLLTFIIHDLARSEFTGEGHRKVWARLRIVDGVKVSRKRTLRVMRENNLLSPHRPRAKTASGHKGEIITDEPNLMWGADGSKILTVDEGWVWLFATLEHWNSECLGWHVSKAGTRFQALEPIAMALGETLGGVGSQVARGLKLRMDHGSQYTADDFRNQIKFWGMTPSYAFIEQPQTNGVAERFFRTLKEQVIYGRTFKNAEEVRLAVEPFIESYNRSWRLERLGYMSPVEYRQAYLTRKAA